MIEKRKGFTYITSLPDDEQFVAMTTYEGRVIIASTKSIYQLQNGNLSKIKIEVEDETQCKINST